MVRVEPSQWSNSMKTRTYIRQSPKSSSAIYVQKTPTGTFGHKIKVNKNGKVNITDTAISRVGSMTRIIRY